jgi:hypothetical protein
MNLIIDLLNADIANQIIVITTKNSSPFPNQSFIRTKIWRFGYISDYSIWRYLTYVFYNFLATILLLINRPKVVVVFETFSVFPAYVYSSIFKKTKIHLHYHEYLSNEEKEIASGYLKILLNLEGSLLKKYTSSQTNEDRKDLFLKDNRQIHCNKVLVFPNLPPTNWWLKYGRVKSPWKGGKIKLVHVGVLDADTMFLEEILIWVNRNINEVDLTIFSQSISPSAEQLLSKYQSLNIHIEEPIYYYDLPKKLTQFDIGLVLYKGHIPNYVYNVPNKVYEYLSCGLTVLSSIVLISVQKLNNNKVVLKDLEKIDLSLLDEMKLLLKNSDNVKAYINEPSLSFHLKSF